MGHRAIPAPRTILLLLGFLVGTDAALGKTALYNALGQYSGILQICLDLVDIAQEDPRLKDFRRDGKNRFYLNKGTFAKGLSGYLCEFAGGPCKYPGKSIKNAHYGMGISGAEFDAFVDDMDKALKHNSIKNDARAAVLKHLKGLKAQVVDPEAARKKALAAAEARRIPPEPTVGPPPTLAPQTESDPLPDPNEGLPDSQLRN